MADLDDLPPPPGVYSIETPSNPEAPTSIGFDGQGKAKYPNGDEYDGLYANGVRHGAGTYFYRDTQDKFKGTFDQNQKSGMGRVDYKAGGYYHGFFENGKRHGEGTFQYPNKDIYSGMWKEGKRHGKGTYVYANTKYELKGVWKEGQIVQGTWTFTDGTRFVGSFQQNKPCGDGVWETKQGTIVEGAYVQQVVPIDGAPKRPDGTPATETRIFWNTATMVAMED
jgi:hypothetical protein